MNLSPNISLPNYRISTLSRGCWQLANNHSSRTIIDESAFGSLDDFIEAGITTLVCSDLYEGVEELIGRYFHQLTAKCGADAREAIQIHTTYAPGFMDNGTLVDWSPSKCVSAIDSALQRLQISSIDAVYLHWSDYAIPGYIEAALTLQKLKAAGKIRSLGVTNFDVIHLEEIVLAGVEIDYNMVQYSVLDRRPEHRMTDYCKDNQISLCCYGALGGGFLSLDYLGVPDPKLSDFHNASKEKYYGTICDFGGWSLYQELLKALQIIAQKHDVSIASVAIRYILDKPSVASVIVGALDSSRLPDTTKSLHLKLGPLDLQRIDSVLNRSTPPDSDCYSIERSTGRIVKESN